jgi:hypothetical protein
MPLRRHGLTRQHEVTALSHQSTASTIVYCHLKTHMATLDYRQLSLQIYHRQALIGLSATTLTFNYAPLLNLRSQKTVLVCLPIPSSTPIPSFSAARTEPRRGFLTKPKDRKGEVVLFALQLSACTGKDTLPIRWCLIQWVSPLHC